MRHAAPSLAALLLAACGTTAPGGMPDEPPPCDSGAPDAITCGDGERCLEGTCTPWAEKILAQGIDCRPALGAGEVVYFAEGELRAVAKSGGVARTIGPAVADDCGDLKVDGGQVFLFYNSPRDWMGTLYGYPASGGDPVALTSDLRYVNAAVAFGDRAYVAVGTPSSSELLSVDPRSGAGRSILATEGWLADVARVGDELFFLEVESEPGSTRGSVVWLFPDGTRGPVLATAGGDAWLETTDRGLLLVTNSCDDESRTLQLQLRRAGTDAFEPPAELPCDGDLVAVDATHAYFRDHDDADRRLWRRPVSGGEPVRVEGSDALWYVFGLDDGWLYGVRDGTIVRIPR